MLFNKNKSRRTVVSKKRPVQKSQAVLARRPTAYGPGRRAPQQASVGKWRPTHRPPSWRSFKTRKRPTLRRGGTLVSIRTPKLGVSDIRMFFLRITYNALFLLLGVGIVYFLFFSEWLQISNVLVEGNKTIDKKLILDATEPYLHKKAFWFFPSNNFFFVPTGQIAKEILSDYKRIGDVKVSRGFPNSLAIRLQEKKAVLLFCSDQGCVWVDEEGVVYNKSSYAEAVGEGSDVVIVEDNSHGNYELGQLVTEPAYVDYANRLWHIFPEKIGKELVHLSAPLPSAQEIRANTKEGWMVFFDTTMDLDRSVALLQKVIEQELKDKEGGTICVDYIDLRVVDRVFYKMKDSCGNNGENQNPEQAENQENNNSNDNQQVDQTNLDQQEQPKENSNSNKDSKSSDKKKKKKN